MGFHFSHKSTAALAETLASGGAVLAAFGEGDAPACRLEEPVLGEIQRRYGERIGVVLADVAGTPTAAAAYAVSAVPTFLLFVDGVEKMRLVGYQSADDLSRALDEALPQPA